MKQYAMVPICSKEDENGNPIIRRVLIEFESTTIINGTRVLLTGTHFVDCDPYFNKKNASHKYEFEDDGYRLVMTTSDVSWFYCDYIYDKRPYHYFVSTDDILKPPAIIFKAEDDEKAKRKFHQRKEKRD